ncbi:MAG: tyrosine-type recombinase/integrase [Cyanobacteria bacterium P01_D01_bin.115]
MARPNKPWYWKARKAWYVTIDGKRHNLGRDEAEAHQRFYDLKAADPGQVPDSSVIALLDAFLQVCEESKAAATLRWYTDYLQDLVDYLKSQRINPSALPAEKLTPRHVRGWINKREKAKRARMTVVKAAYRWAHGEGWIRTNPLGGMTRPSTSSRNETVSLQGMRQILRHTKDRNFRDLLVFCWDVGCRPQEAKGLRTDQLDLANSRCIIHESEAKGNKKQRVIYLTKRAKRIVERNVNDGPTVFVNTQGRPWTASAVKCRFVRLEKLIGKRYCQYMWRHTFATRKLTEGVPAIVVAELLGHSDVSTLAKTYQHVNQDASFMLSALETQ